MLPVFSSTVAPTLQFGNRPRMTNGISSITILTSSPPQIAGHELDRSLWNHIPKINAHLQDAPVYTPASGMIERYQLLLYATTSLHNNARVDSSSIVDIESFQDYATQNDAVTADKSSDAHGYQCSA